VTAGSEEAGNGDEFVEKFSLELDTKYYTATLSVWVTSSGADAGSEEEKETSEGTPSEGKTEAKEPVLTLPEPVQTCSALFVSSDVGNPRAWKYTEAFLRAVPDSFDGGPEIRAVCVSDRAAAPAAPWFLELGAELVHTSEAVASGEGDHDEDDTDWSRRDLNGADRLIEMLEAHVWPELEMKTPAGAGKSAPPKPIAANAGADIPDVSVLTELMRSAYMGEDPELEPVDDEDAEVAELDSFAMALGELQNLRGVASNLPDEQRHELASRVAMSMLQFMNEDDGDL
jgi:Alpha and gamma adaptin binding protein p34